MLHQGEITEEVSKYLQLGGDKLSKFYHLLKTHNIPTSLENPSSWLEEQGFPIRGIISGKGGPTERLAWFIDHFLQPGMKALPSFLFAEQIKKYLCLPACLPACPSVPDFEFRHKIVFTKPMPVGHVVVLFVCQFFMTWSGIPCSFHKILLL